MGQMRRRRRGRRRKRKRRKRMMMRGIKESFLDFSELHGLEIRSSGKPKPFCSEASL